MLSVIVDPGHGGHDGGATRGQHKESEIVLKISEHLQSLLKKDPRFHVSLTRSDNEFVPLSQRARQANTSNADLFVSIHVNSSPDVHAKGLEVYIQNQLPPDEESMYLANLEHEGYHDEDSNFTRDELQGLKVTEQASPEVKNILKDMIRGHRIRESAALSKEIYKKWRGSKKSKQNSILQAPFFVVSNVNMPSALVELGFVSNEDDAKNLNNPVHQKEMAESLYASLVAYKESMDKSQPTP